MISDIVGFAGAKLIGRELMTAEMMTMRDPWREVSRAAGVEQRLSQRGVADAVDPAERRFPRPHMNASKLVRLLLKRRAFTPDAVARDRLRSCAAAILDLVRNPTTDALLDKRMLNSKKVARSPASHTNAGFAADPAGSPTTPHMSV
jgi:hypothetical protein